MTPGRPTAIRAAAFVSLAVAAALFAKGLTQFLFVHNAGFDFRLLWTATHYYLRGVNPFDASFYYADVHRGMTPLATPVYLPDLGWPEQVNYPPTSTLTQVLLFGLPWGPARMWYLAVNAACGAVVAVWASRFGAAAGERWLLAGVALANLGYSQTILNGNQGIVAMGALVGAIALRRDRPWLAGVCLALALVKPTISVPFVLLFVVERRYALLAGCAACLAASTALTVALSHTALATLLAQTLEGAARFATGGFSLSRLVRDAGVSEPVSLALNAMVFLVPLVALLWRMRRREDVCTPPMLAATAVVARLFTYHNSIDDVLLTFLVVALGARALETRRATDAVWAAVVVVSVLVPFVWVATMAGHAALFAIWIAGAVYVVGTAAPPPVVAMSGAVRPGAISPFAVDR